MPRLANLEKPKKMNKIKSIALKIALTIVTIYFAGLINIFIFKNEIQPNKPMPFPLSIATFLGIFLIWRHKFFKSQPEENKPGDK